MVISGSITAHTPAFGRVELVAVQQHNNLKLNLSLLHFLSSGKDCYKSTVTLIFDTFEVFTACQNWFVRK